MKSARWIMRGKNQTRGRSGARHRLGTQGPLLDPNRTDATGAICRRILKLHKAKRRWVGLFRWIRVCDLCGTSHPCQLREWARTYLGERP